MKKLSVIFIYLFSWVFAQEIFVKEYENAKAVFAAPRLHVSHSVRKLENDKNQYLLKVYSEYQSIRKDNQMSKIQTDFQGYQFKLLSLRASSSHSKREILIKPLEKVEMINIISTSNGPIIEGEYVLSKSEAQLLSEVKDINDLIILEDNLFETGIRESFSIERFSLKNFKCRDLFKDSHRAFDVFENYYKLVEKIKRMSFQFSSTKESLINNLMSECIGYPAYNSFQSFKELFNTELYLLDSKDSIVGTTELMINESFQAPLYLYSKENK